MKRLFSIFLFSYFALTYPNLGSAQTIEQPQKEIESTQALQVSMDCRDCDEIFFRQSLEGISFVRDQKEADVHLLFLSQPAGNGGRKERIQFIGKGLFKHLSDLLTYDLSVDITTDERRQLRLKYIELGLIRFRIEAGQADDISVLVKPSGNVVQETEVDPWRGWVFGTNLNGWFNGQETSNAQSWNGSISGNHITERFKFAAWGGFSQNKNTFNYDGVKTISRKQSVWLNSTNVLSLGEHWSAGLFTATGNSLFGNYRFYTEGKTGMEYDFFTYSESFEKQAIVAYNVGTRFNEYYDTTVFYKESDLLAFQEITVGGVVKQSWGNVSSTVTYQNYLHDFSLNAVSLWVNLKVRLFKGFSWRINGSLDITNNQVNIAKQNASIADVLLQQQQLGSGYSYWMNTGINYSFGSKFSTVVNPRFTI